MPFNFWKKNKKIWDLIKILKENGKLFLMNKTFDYRKKNCYLSAIMFPYFFWIWLPFNFWKKNKKIWDLIKILKENGKLFLINHQKPMHQKQKRCLKCLKSGDLNRLLSASFCDLSSTLTVFTTLDANGMKSDLFKKIGLPMEGKYIYWIVLEPINKEEKDFHSTPKQFSPSNKEKT